MFCSCSPQSGFSCSWGPTEAELHEDDTGTKPCKCAEGVSQILHLFLVEDHQAAHALCTSSAAPCLLRFSRSAPCLKPCILISSPCAACLLVYEFLASFLPPKLDDIVAKPWCFRPSHGIINCSSSCTIVLRVHVGPDGPGYIFILEDCHAAQDVEAFKAFLPGLTPPEALMSH